LKGSKPINGLTPENHEHNVVDDDEDGVFELMSDEELDPNSTISTSVCKVSEIPSGASNAAVFPSTASSDVTKARPSASVAASSCTTSAALITYWAAAADDSLIRTSTGISICLASSKAFWIASSLVFFLLTSLDTNCVASATWSSSSSYVDSFSFLMMTVSHLLFLVLCSWYFEFTSKHKQQEKQEKLKNCQDLGNTRIKWYCKQGIVERFSVVCQDFVTRMKVWFCLWNCGTILCGVARFFWRIWKDSRVSKQSWRDFYNRGVILGAVRLAYLSLSQFQT